MSFQADVLNVFIASPSDVAAERDEVEQAIFQWNSLYAEELKVILLPKRWEKDTFPAYRGNDPQQLINEQVVKNCDILVGIFWNKLGSPTLNHGSGTLEEIQFFIDKQKDVLVYFVEKDVPRNNYNYAEMAQVDEYKKKYSGLALYSVYAKDKVIDHLYRTVSARIKQAQIVSNKNMSEPITKADANESRLEKLIRTRVLLEEEILLLAYSKDTGNRDFQGFNDPGGMYAKLKAWTKLNDSQLSRVAEKYTDVIANLVEREILFKDSEYRYKHIKNHRLSLEILNDLRALSPEAIAVINDTLENYSKSKFY
ncbi:MAG: DUF4062 domain-containing protein [Candidatus Pristimantibacillus sp.]